MIKLETEIVEALKNRALEIQQSLTAAIDKDSLDSYQRDRRGKEQPPLLSKIPDYGRLYTLCSDFLYHLSLRPQPHIEEARKIAYQLCAQEASLYQPEASHPVVKHYRQFVAPIQRTFDLAHELLLATKHLQPEQPIPPSNQNALSPKSSAKKQQNLITDNAVPQDLKGADVEFYKHLQSLLRFHSTHEKTLSSSPVFHDKQLESAVALAIALATDYLQGLDVIAKSDATCCSKGITTIIAEIAKADAEAMGSFPYNFLYTARTLIDLVANRIQNRIEPSTELQDYFGIDNSQPVEHPKRKIVSALNQLQLPAPQAAPRPKG